MSNTLYSFEPDWRHEVLPGDSIAERIDDLNLSKKEFTIRMGYSAKHIHQLLKAEARISEDTALRLEKVLDIPASFWMNLESSYRKAVAKERERIQLANSVGWLKQIPLHDMIKFGWVKKCSDKQKQIQECLKFYGASSIEAWQQTQKNNYQAVFKSADKFTQNDIAVQTWLRQGEREAQSIHCEPFDKSKLNQSLSILRELTLEKKSFRFAGKLKELCRCCGVAMVFVPTPNNCPMSGATKWLSPSKVLLMLSLRHKTNDHLWFAFFHEIAHILKHKKQTFLENTSKHNAFIKDEMLEKEANEFAAKTLIPNPSDLQSLKSERDIVQYAKTIGTDAGIVVGRMQHEELIDWQQYNHLKTAYHFTAEG